jgi:hypothetical protein
MVRLLKAIELVILLKLQICRPPVHSPGPVCEVSPSLCQINIGKIVAYQRAVKTLLFFKNGSSPNLMGVRLPWQFPAIALDRSPELAASAVILESS